uniref:Pentatricopeptide repeat-containing protein n=1 Tax=Tanacetum cinerariifolium TaxID=118510 RepID=A0A6L2KSR3_TANCI|nr:pentatricopeptide repeat-containing protein [Tanacetum cinerariifolium]
MPQATVGDTSLTRSYIPKVSQTPDISPSITHFYKPIEDRCIHEGRVVDQLYYISDHIYRCFSNIRLNFLYEVNEPIVSRFILDFYSQVTLQRDDSVVILISFMIQNEFTTPSCQQFGQILRIPFTGQAVFTNEWDLGSLAYSQKTEGPYHTDLPTPKEIYQFFQFQRVDPNRTIKNKNVIISQNQVLTKELRQDLKRWNKLIYENVFGLGGHRDHLPACLAHILYCIHAEQQYNLTYFFVKRIESARVTPKAYLPYACRPRSDRGKARHSISLTSAHHNRGSSSHQGDDDEDDGASRASTPSPTTYLNSLGPLDYQPYYIPTSSEQNDDLLFERQTDLLNQTQQMHKELRDGFNDEDCSTSGSEDEEYAKDEEYAMATFQRSRDDKNGKSDRKCFRCGYPNHLIGECPKPPKDKNQRAFVGGFWSDSGEEDDEKVKDEMCLVAHASRYEHVVMTRGSSGNSISSISVGTLPNFSLFSFLIIPKDFYTSLVDIPG